MLFSKRELFGMVLPMMIQQVLAITVGTADSIMVVSTLSMWIVRVGFSCVFWLETAQLFGFFFPGFGMGIMGVWVAMAGDRVVRPALYTTRLMRGT